MRDDNREVSFGLSKDRVRAITRTRMGKSTDKPIAFVAMCFDERLYPIYQKVVKPVLEEYGFECKRGDEIWSLE